jgi:hypothetical protein
MGVIGRPRDWSFRCEWAGGFRRTPDEPFMPCRLWQYDTRVELARVCRLRVRMAGLVPVIAHDTYVRGEGRMLARLLDFITVADATGPELDTGELVTYLNDAILMAPSMLLGPETRWSVHGEHSFDVSLTDRGRTVCARVYVDALGAPVNFSTTDRFYRTADDQPWVRCRWTTPIEGWTFASGRPLPKGGAATWHLLQGRFTYVELRLLPESVAFNVAPPLQDGQS